MIANPRTRTVAPRTGDGPHYMELHERNQLIRAAVRAQLVFPGALGELVHRELMAVQEFGYLVCKGSLIQRLVEQVNAAEVPPKTS